MTPDWNRIENWHVVHRRWNGRHLGYEIWFRNRPKIRLHDGLRLKRDEAYRLCRSLNG